MKIAIFLAILLLPLTAIASPFVVCDTMTADSFLYSLDGGAWTPAPYQTMVAYSDGKTYAVIADTEPMSVGAHTIQVIAISGGTESPITTFDFPVIAPPTGFKVIKGPPEQLEATTSG